MPLTGVGTTIASGPVVRAPYEVGAAVVGNTIYVVGGSDGPGQLDTVYALTVN
ncbi:MAG: hypothetical protein H6Q90_6336 [Deltaproteobacteria bacterium]|nr:hypothetical protein [Deltaproteobacteria bacterium]